MMELQGAGVPAAATNDGEALLRDPQLAQRGYWQYLDRAVVGRLPHSSPAYRVGDTPFPIAAPSPTLGQHNEEVLCGVLGLGRGDLNRLTDLGIIGTRPRAPGEGK